MDNGTTVEVFKSLNYCQLANSSLVSKKFRDLIRNNRHRLALLYVSNISMGVSHGSPLFIKLFYKNCFSPEEYNEWIIHNQYSKQIPFELQEIIFEMQSMHHEPRIYKLSADAGGKSREWNSLFFVYADLNTENWPLFQHFIRLLTDPFVYLHDVSFDWTAQKVVFNLLTGIIDPDRNRLECHEMNLCSGHNALDFSNLITWVKCHLLCDNLEIFVCDYEGLYPDKALTNFILTGGHCTSAIWITNAYEFSNVFADLTQKFLDLKKGDECQVVQSIKGRINNHNVEVFKRNCGQFIVKEEKMEDNSKELVFEFINKDIDQKFQFTAAYF